MVTKAVISHYYSGQGRLAAGLRGVDGQPLGLRPVGNVNELTLTISGDTATIKRPVNGKLVDMEVYTKSTTIKVSAKLESATARNLAMLTHGAFGDERPEYIVDVNARGFFGALQPLRGMGTTNMSARIGATLLTPYQGDTTAWDFMPVDGGAGVVLNDGMDAPVDKLATVGVTVSTTAPTTVDGITRFTLPVPASVKPGQRVMPTGFVHSSLLPYNNKAATIVGCSDTWIDLLLGNTPQALAGNPGRLLLDGLNLAVEYTSSGYSQYTATTDLGGEFYLRFDGMNMADAAAPVTVEIWRVKLDPSCVRSLLNDELEQVTLTGTVLYDRFRPFTPFYTEKFLNLTSVGAKDAPLGDTGFFSGWDAGAGGGPGGGGPGGGTGSNTFPSVDWLKDYLSGALGEGQFAADVQELLHSSEVVRAEIDTILSQVNNDLAEQEAQVAQLTTDAQTSAQNFTDLAATQAAETATRAQETAALADAADQHVTELTALAAAAQATADQAAQAFLDEASVRSQAVSDLVSEQSAQSARLQQAADDLLIEQNARVAAISNEQTLRQTADESLAQTISQMSAGTGDQFDPLAIWYFDTTTEGWGGNGSPSIDQGWLRPADAASDPYVASPTGLAVAGQSYRYARLRLKRVGAPVWEGTLRWRLLGDAAGAWSAPVAVTEPAFDTDGIATVSWEDVAWWPGTVDQIRLDMGTGQSATDYFLIDWVAIGRPTPGAGVAALQAETTARVTADAAESTERTLLAAQLRGTYTGTDIASVATGLMASERTARVAADDVLTQSVLSLSSAITDMDGALDGQATALSTLATRVTNAEDVNVAQTAAIDNLQSTLDDPTSGLAATAAAVQGLTTRVTENEGELETLSTSVTALTNNLETTNTEVDQLQSDVSLQSSATALLTSRVADTEAGLVSQGDATTALTNRLDTVEVDLAGTMTQATATAGALDTLTNRVTVNEGHIDSSSAAITALNNSVYSATAGLATKASAAALSAMDTRVATAEDAIDSQSTALTSLQNTIDNPSSGLAAKASATALTSLTNEVHDSNTGLATRASSAAVTALTNTINNTDTGLPSKATASALQSLTTRVDNVEAATGVTTDLSARVDTVEGALINEMITRANQTSVLASSVNSLSARMGTAEDAVSAAVTGLSSLTTRVDSVEGTVTSQGTSLTSLQAQVDAMDVDAGGYGSAISALDTRVTSTENTLASQGSAITSLQNSVTSANKTFIQDTAPDVDGRTTGDLWINTTNGENKLYGFNGTTWVLRQDTTKNAVFVQGTAPTPTAVNDVWFDTSRNNRQFRWSGTAWVEITDTRVAANATAITNLTTRVSAAEGVNTSQSASITTLENTVNNASTGVAATASAVGTLTSRVTDAEGAISTNSSAITTLQNTVNNASTGVVATANALGSLTTRVTATETVNTSQGSAITSLQNTVNNATTGVAATASAVSALTTRVTTTENTTSSQGSAITTLQNTVNNSTTGVTATASAVSALSTRVSSVEGVNSSQATSISSISTTVGNHTASINSQQTSINGVLAKAGLALDVNGYVIGWQLNNNGSSGSMTILASQFAVVSPGGGQRTEYSGGNWRVYDSNGTLRVQFGVW